MHLHHYKIDKLSKDLKRIVYDQIDIDKFKLFYFGSRVAGNHFERSDIDVGIEGSTPIDVHKLNNIKDKVEELPILYTIDIVDFSKVPKRFHTIASKHKEYIN